jgi:LysR family transcriptional regulator for bpeEF and oprC
LKVDAAQAVSSSAARSGVIRRGNAPRAIIDFIVRLLPLPPPQGRRRASINFLTAAAPSYLARFGMPRHPNDLAQHRCVNYFSAKTGKVYDWDFNRNGERIEVPMPGVIALNDSNTYVQAGLAGLGIVQMTDYLLARHVEEGRLVQVLPDWVSDPLPVHIVYPQNRHMSAKVRVFVEWVSEVFAKHPQMHLGAQPAFAPAASAAA